MLLRRVAVIALLTAVALLCAARPTLLRAQDAQRPPADAVELTSNDNGGTLFIGSDQTLFVRLDPGSDWTVTADDETILQPLTPDAGLPDGTQTAFSALAPGTTTVRATGRAHCQPGQPCPQFAVLFTAAIDVLPAGVVVLGPDANDGTIAITQDETVIIQLGAGFDWSFSYDPPNALAPVQYFPVLPASVQIALQPQQSGAVTISGTGKAHCDRGQACIALAAVFSTTLVVQ
jgi:hypothetical protein